MTDVIVIASVAFGMAFLAVWLLKPSVRAWVERPKYRFQANVQSYDEMQKQAERSGNR